MEIQFEKYIRDTREAQELGNAYQFIFDKLENDGQTLIDNQFILSADLITIREWEKFLSIPADDNLSLEERKNQVLLYLNLKPPYTLNNVKKQIYSFTGVENKITEDRDNLHIDIDLSGVGKNTYKLVNSFMRKVKPTNVTYSISTTPPDLEDNGRFYMATFVTKNIVVI